MINGKRVIAITLARGGSKGIPGKNWIDLNGKPLIQYTIDEVKKSKYINTYIVSSDNNYILEIASNNKCSTFKRETVEDWQTSAAGLIETLKHIYVSDDDIIVEVMATNPLKIAEDIDNTIEKIFEGDCAVSVVESHYHPSRIKYIENNELKDFYQEPTESRRQDLRPKAYMRNGSVYVMYYKDLIENKARLTGKIIPYIMPKNKSVNIDEPIDLVIAKHLMNENKRY